MSPKNVGPESTDADIATATLDADNTDDDAFLREIDRQRNYCRSKVYLACFFVTGLTYGTFLIFLITNLLIEVQEEMESDFERKHIEVIMGNSIWFFLTLLIGIGGFATFLFKG